MNCIWRSNTFLTFRSLIDDRLSNRHWSYCASCTNAHINHCLEEQLWFFKFKCSHLQQAGWAAFANCTFVHFDYIVFACPHHRQWTVLLLNLYLQYHWQLQYPRRMITTLPTSNCHDFNCASILCGLEYTTADHPSELIVVSSELYTFTKTMVCRVYYVSVLRTL